MLYYLKEYKRPGDLDRKIFFSGNGDNKYIRPRMGFIVTVYSENTVSGAEKVPITEVIKNHFNSQ